MCVCCKCHLSGRSYSRDQPQLNCCSTSETYYGVDTLDSKIPSHNHLHTWMQTRINLLIDYPYIYSLSPVVAPQWRFCLHLWDHKKALWKSNIFFWFSESVKTIFCWGLNFNLNIGGLLDVCPHLLDRPKTLKNKKMIFLKFIMNQV